MPVITIPPAGGAPFHPGNHWLVPLIDFHEDGVTVDTVEPLTITATQPGVHTPSLVPDPTGQPSRLLKIYANAAGTGAVTVTGPDVPPSRALTVNVTVSAPPNLSKIEAGTPSGPHPGP